MVAAMEVADGDEIMNDSIKKTIPFSEEDLDKYLENIKDYDFIIDVHNSKYKNKQLLNYIYNCEMNCDFEIINYDDEVELLLLEYIKDNKLNSIPRLNFLWIEILAYVLKIDIQTNYMDFIENFSKNNALVVKELLSILKSLKLHLFQLFFDENGIIKDKENKNNNLIGNNFISLRNSSAFWIILEKLDGTDIEVFNYNFFNDYSFEGYKINYYFENNFNPFSYIHTLKKIAEKNI